MKINLSKLPEYFRQTANELESNKTYHVVKQAKHFFSNCRLNTRYQQRGGNCYHSAYVQFNEKRNPDPVERLFHLFTSDNTSKIYSKKM